MTNEHTKAELTSILSEVKDQFRTIARIQSERADLVGTGSVLRNRVTVTVNADGTVIETRFGVGIEDLSYSEIARAVTDAAQRASEDLARRNAELMEPMQNRRARLPKLSDLIEDMPDLRLPDPPKPSLAPPGSVDRAATGPAEEMRYDDVEDISAQPERRITDTGW